jgi:glycosyltransferase involved in cell wall biosynthesis
VVADFRRELPQADIYVYDNNSTDNTVAEAIKAGAIVRDEKKQGKGNVMRAMFHEIEADVYVMVDGDDTYPADKVHDLIRPVVERSADMVIGSRLHELSSSEFKKLNRFGNKIFLTLINKIFRVSLTDLLSGYRAMNKNIINLPLLTRGFDIETELTLKTIQNGLLIKEVPVDLAPRPEGSSSKIKIMSDGFLIVSSIISLARDYKPLTTFGAAGLFILLLGLIPGFVVVNEFIATKYITHVPLAILSVGTVLTGMILMFTGLVLHTITRRFQELNHLMQGLLKKTRGQG